jgi:hypothetical protein
MGTATRAARVARRIIASPTHRNGIIYCSQNGLLIWGVARQCIFCDNTADSKEHLWPAWILKRLNIKRPMLHTLGRYPAKIVPRTELEIRCVCALCNNGWMHDLEDLNIPIVGCLMEDMSVPLGFEQQSTVARWAVKTAMCQDAIDTRNRVLFYSTSERLALRSNTGIPSYTRIWLGRSSIKTLSASGADIGGDINDGNKVLEVVNGSVNTFVVGHLAIQVATLHAPAKYDGHPLDITPWISGPWDDLLIPIWPITETVNWPPPLTLMNSRGGIARLNERFNGGTAF